MSSLAGGFSTFLSLEDTPDSYTGQGSKAVSVNAGATALAFTTAGATTVYADAVSGSINGSNKAFTVTNTISTAYALFLANAVLQPTTDFTVSGTDVTMIVAPDASLSGQPFWLLHS